MQRTPASGGDDLALKPTFAIRLLAETLLPDVPGHAHRYRFCDADGRALIEHGGIALFELPKRERRALESRLGVNRIGPRRNRSRHDNRPARPHRARAGHGAPRPAPGCACRPFSRLR
jgi:hypothetical protein